MQDLSITELLNHYHRLLTEHQEVYALMLAALLGNGGRLIIPLETFNSLLINADLRLQSESNDDGNVEVSVCWGDDVQSRFV